MKREAQADPRLVADLKRLLALDCTTQEIANEVIAARKLAAAAEDLAVALEAFLPLDGHSEDCYAHGLPECTARCRAARAALRAAGRIK